jgi:hypothetical protein
LGVRIRPGNHHPLSLPGQLPCRDRRPSAADRPVPIATPQLRSLPDPLVHRNACVERLEWADADDSVEPFPPLPVPDRYLDHDERILAVDGKERAATVVSHGSDAALRFSLSPVLVTAVARLGFPPALVFRVIDGLEPYFAGYRRFVLRFLRLLSTAAHSK